MVLRCYDINKNYHTYSAFNVVVYPDTHKSSERPLAGTYIHHVNDILTSREDSPVYRDIVINLQPSEEGYFVTAEDRRGLKEPGCGNFFLKYLLDMNHQLLQVFILNMSWKKIKYIFLTEMLQAVTLYLKWNLKMKN